jgi:hypothetical protein
MYKRINKLTKLSASIMKNKTYEEISSILSALSLLEIESKVRDIILSTIANPYMKKDAKWALTAFILKKAFGRSCSDLRIDLMP